VGSRGVLGGNMSVTAARATEGGEVGLDSKATNSASFFLTKGSDNVLGTPNGRLLTIMHLAAPRTGGKG
jgi:hypothetical protein